MKSLTVFLFLITQSVIYGNLYLNNADSFLSPEGLSEVSGSLGCLILVIFAVIYIYSSIKQRDKSLIFQSSVTKKYHAVTEELASVRSYYKKNPADHSEDYLRQTVTRLFHIDHEKDELFGRISAFYGFSGFHTRGQANPLDDKVSRTRDRKTRARKWHPSGDTRAGMALTEKIKLNDRFALKKEVVKSITRKYERMHKRDRYEL